MSTNPPALGLLVLRVVFGGFMALNHGLPKLLKAATLSETFASFLPVPSSVSLALAIFGELACAVLIVIGLGTRWACLPAIITMLVAAFGAHGDAPLKEGEHALLFAGAFLAIALLGPGPWSLDARIAAFRGRRA